MMTLVIMRCHIGLAQADIIGNEEIHAGKAERFPERFELIGIDPNPRAEG